MTSTNSTEKRDSYQVITNLVLDALQDGTAVWQKPWVADGGQAPRNLLTGKPYRGINPFLLNFVAIRNGYRSPYWLTFKQAKDLGGKVGKGQKGSTVVFWKQLAIKDDAASERQGETVTKNIPLLRFYYVWNLEQTEGCRIPSRVEQEQAAAAERAARFNPIDEAEAIAARYSDADGPKIRYGGNRAAYSPGMDIIVMPEREQFEAPELFYKTLFHEQGHSTGAEHRLDRPGFKDIRSFGDENYSREELVAEFTAAFLAGQAGISLPTIENTASYIDHWRQFLTADPRAVVVAAGQAQKAADYILGEVTEAAEVVASTPAPADAAGVLQEAA